MQKILRIMLGSALMIPFALGAFVEQGSAEGVQNSTVVSTQEVSDATKVHSSTLANGLTVIVQQDKRFPLVSLRLYVHAGSAYETDAQSGISHVLEHMVFKGTTKRPKGAVATEVERNGGYLNAATSFDYTVYLTDMTAASWKVGLDVLRDMAFNPTLDPKELASEQDVIVAELERGEDQPGSRIFQILQKGVFEGTGYARPIIGTRETIRSVTRETLREYIAHYYQPQSMLLLVCGDVDVAEVQAEAQRLFGGLTNNKTLAAPVHSPSARLQATAPSVTVEYGPWNKVYLGVAFPSPAGDDVSIGQLDVLATLLGGDASAYFPRTYRYEKRLVDSISVANYSFEHTGMFYFSVTLDADKLPRFWEEFTRDLGAIQTMNFTQVQLDRAKLAIEDELFRSQETLAGLTSKQGYFYFLGGGSQGEANYLTVVAQSDLTQVRAVAKQIFQPQYMTVATLLPQVASNNATVPTNATVAAQPAAFGQVQMEALLARTWPVAHAGAATQAAAMASGEREVVDLGQGRTLILIPDTTLPYTAVDLVFTGGSSLLSDQKQQGLANLTAGSLTRGTMLRSAIQVEDFLADRAASLSAAAGVQQFSLHMRYPVRFAGDMLQLLQETLASPAFAPEEVSRVKQLQIAAIKRQEDSPLDMAFRRLGSFLFGEHPYGALVSGTETTLASFTEVDVRRFWQTQRSQGWVLSVCGQFSRDVLIAEAKKIPAATALVKPLADPVWGTDNELIVPMPGRNQAHLMLLFKTVPTTHPDAPGLALLQNILSGQSGLLFSDLRDKQGLGYTVTSFQRQMQQAGFMVFYIGTEPDKLEQAKQGFLKVITAMRAKPLPNAALERGKNLLVGDYYRQNQSLGSRSLTAAQLQLQGRPLDTEIELLEQAKALTPQDIHALVKKYITPDAYYTVIVLPE